MILKSIVEMKDKQLIRELLAINNAYLEVSYDGSPAIQDFHPTGVWIVLCDNGYTAGFINLEPLNNVTWMPHIYIYEQHRGYGSEEWGKQAAEYMKEEYGVQKFLAFTPYLSAKRYAEKIGFTNIGILTGSIKKNGELLDQFILEMQ